MQLGYFGAKYSSNSEGLNKFIIGELLFDIGFINISVWDVLDIAIVGYLLYSVYRLLRGSIAFNIFVGVILLYVVWWLVGVLQMDLLSYILSQFVSVGVIILIIIFQPEIRRFLLFLGNTTLKRRSNIFSRFFSKGLDISEDREKIIQAIRGAVSRMGRKKTGALIVLSGAWDMESKIRSGVIMNADVSQALLESIFHKDSPLHDGAVVISGDKVLAASCILPVSDNPTIPRLAGLRHRAAVGISETANVIAIIVSEETGRISYAEGGNLHMDIDEEQLYQVLVEYFKSVQ